MTHRTNDNPDADGQAAPQQPETAPIETAQPDYRLDLFGEPCPYPALQAVEALASLPPGKTLEILTDCPQAFVAIPDDAVRHGHELLREPVRRGPETTFLIRTRG